jgi:alkylation response protein AidB-like acyl-CoA dehydrogenase
MSAPARVATVQSMTGQEVGAATAGTDVLNDIDVSWPMSEDERDLVEALKQLVADKIAPRAQLTDEEGTFPTENVKALNEMGCNAVFVPEEYGGIGASYACYLRMVEEISRGCPSTAITWATTYHGVSPLLRFGTEEQKATFLPMIANGAIGALAITEETGGSDVRAIRTTIRPDGDELVINGSKIFITNGDVADIYLVLGKWTEMEDQRNAISAVIVEGKTKGLEVIGVESKLGHRGSSTASLAFDEMRVPRANLLGAPGEGFAILIAALNKSRPSIAAHALGIARSAFDDAVAHVNERTQFGKRILEFQGVQFMIADLATRLAMAEAWLMFVAEKEEAGRGSSGVDASMLKLACTDLAMDAASTAVQLQGGYGYMSGCRAERLFRDAKLTQIWEGANELHRERVGRSFLAQAPR